jgi:hypothetical protein
MAVKNLSLNCATVTFFRIGSGCPAISLTRYSRSHISPARPSARDSTMILESR